MAKVSSLDPVSQHQKRSSRGVLLRDLSATPG